MDQIDAQQELAFIKKVIQDSRRAAVDNGIDYIVWGLLVSLGMFATVLLERLGVRGTAYLILWIAVMGGGWAFSLARHLRAQSIERVHSLAGTILNTLWLGCGIVIMILIFMGGPVMKASPSPYIAAVLGIGFLVSGVLLDFVYFKLSAVCWWLGSAAMFCLNSPWARSMNLYALGDILLFGIMMIPFQVVPGIILYRRWQKEVSGP
jgi:hypothetical protein